MAPYDDIGGAPAIRAALDALYPRVRAEPAEALRLTTNPAMDDNPAWLPPGAHTVVSRLSFHPAASAPARRSIPPAQPLVLQRVRPGPAH